MLALLLVLAAEPAAAQGASDRVSRILRTFPLIDAHNDWAEALLEREGQGRWTLDLRSGLDRKPVAYNTDIARLREGGVGAQFWSAYAPASLPGPDQIKRTLEQIDLIKSWVARYPEHFALARTAQEVRRIFRSGRIASLIGVEGGGQIGGSLSVLRAYHELGVGYLTLTHVRTTEWADAATDAPAHDGLSPFGEAVVQELNRLGMLVDLSHVSDATMRDAMRLSKAPVIFSHSSARAIADHPRNVSDELLRLVAANGGVVMVNFARSYVSEPYRRWEADANAERVRLNAPPYAGLHVGQPQRAAAALERWLAANPAPRVTISQVADHIDHIARVAGVDHVGLGGDFDGVDNALPDGLSDVGGYPALLAELVRRGWTDDGVRKLIGGNILRVMAMAETEAARLASSPATTMTLDADAR